MPKQTQNLSNNKATLHTQYHAKTWKHHPSEKILQSIWKGCFFCRVWCTPDRSIKSWAACIAECSRDIPCKI